MYGSFLGRAVLFIFARIFLFARIFARYSHCEGWVRAFGAREGDEGRRSCVGSFVERYGGGAELGAEASYQY